MGNLKEFLIQKFRKEEQTEDGQSLVLIALALVGLIAFAGLAIDVGFIFAKGSQLQAAIDSAALAGVIEMSGGNNITNQERAITKSGQFLNANGMPISVTNSINNNGYTTFDVTPLGITEYDLTATWPVETFFLKGIGFRDNINLTRSATAAIYSLADIYSSRRVEEGILGSSNQSLFGPLICDEHGDPFSPLNSRFNNVHPYKYRYRVLIPSSYPSDFLRVELFDPDAINSANDSDRVFRSANALSVSSLADWEDLSCDTGGKAVPQKWPCLIETDELTGYGSTGGTPIGGLSPDQVNPYWFLRVDENWGKNNGACTADYNNYRQDTMPQTRFDLYYYRENADGTIERVPLTSYTGQNGSESPNHETDLHWVSPGAEMSFGWDKDSPGVDVPADPGSRTEHGFEIDLTREVPNIVTEAGSGNRFIYLDVYTLNGSAENGFDLWAGPPDYVNSVASNVNDRNIYVLNNPGSHSSRGATVLAMGNLPMNSNASYPVDIPLLYVSPAFAGEEIYISLYDSDAGAKPPVTFFFDSIAQEDFSLVFGDTSNTFDPDGVRVTDRCRPGSCNGQWVDPPYKIEIPGDTENCDQANAATDPDCIPFYGGRLTAHYIGGRQDSYGWQVTITGLPYLVK